MSETTKAKETSTAAFFLAFAGIAGMALLAVLLLAGLHFSNSAEDSFEFSEEPEEDAIPHETLARVVALGGDAGLDAAGAAVLGIDIKLHEGWKTYWRLPWESGLPPLLDWSDSRNLKSARVLWPAPFRFEDAGGAYFGYQEKLLLPVAVRAMDKQRPLQVELLLHYAVCKHVCIPLQERLAWNLAPAGQANSGFDAATDATQVRLHAALERVPAAETAEARFLDARLIGADSESPTLEVRLLLSEPSSAPLRDSFLLVEEPAPVFFGRERLLENSTSGDDGTGGTARVARYSLPVLHPDAAAALRTDGAHLMFRIDGEAAISAHLPVQQAQ